MGIIYPGNLVSYFTPLLSEKEGKGTGYQSFGGKARNPRGHNPWKQMPLFTFPGEGRTEGTFRLECCRCNPGEVGEYNS